MNIIKKYPTFFIPAMLIRDLWGINFTNKVPDEWKKSFKILKRTVLQLHLFSLKKD